MATCKIVIEGEDFKSAEEAFQYQRAKACGAHREMEMILKSEDGYRAKREGGGVTTTPDWDRSEEKVMLDILRAKFRDNREHREALLATGNKILVDFTHDRKWGCGLPLSKIKDTKLDKLPGRNLLGKFLMSVREEIRKD